VALRYFNAAGASRRSGERHDPETHLIPLVLDVAAGSRPDIVVFGDDYPTRDGTCVRDYIHVLDLADAHLRALELLERGESKMHVFNLGCGGEGYTNREVIDCARRVTGRDIHARVGPRRPGDPSCAGRLVGHGRARVGLASDARLARDDYPGTPGAGVRQAVLEDQADHVGAGRQRSLQRSCNLRRPDPPR
jgi:UDP-glucose 4-epimerase